MNRHSLIVTAYDLPEALAVIGQVPMLGITGSSRNSSPSSLWLASLSVGGFCQWRSDVGAESGGREERAPLTEPDGARYSQGGRMGRFETNRK